MLTDRLPATPGMLQALGSTRVIISLPEKCDSFQTETWGILPAILKPHGPVWCWGLGLGALGPQRWDLVCGADSLLGGILHESRDCEWLVPSSILNIKSRTRTGQAALTNTLLIKWMNTCTERNKDSQLASFLPPHESLAATDLRRLHRDFSKSSSFGTWDCKTPHAWGLFQTRNFDVLCTHCSFASHWEYPFVSLSFLGC